MSGATPPEMDDFSQLLLNQAKGQRERTGSTGSGSYYAYAEPEQLNSRGSSSGTGQRQNSQRQNSGESINPLHQDSYSLNNPPTIFATSPMPTSEVSYNQDYQYNAYQNGQSDYGNAQQPQTNPDQFWTNYIQEDGQQQQQQQQQYPPQQQPQQQPQLQNQQFNQQSYPQYDQSGANNIASTSYNPAWSEQFVQQQQQNGGGFGQQVDMGNGGWNGMNGLPGAINAPTNDNTFQDDLAEIIRSANASRAPTPQPDDSSSFLNQQPPPLPQPNSRSVSPFQAAPSPYQSTSSRNNSPFMKPTSPPALIIPGNGNAPSPAPNLPPIITNTTTQPPPPRMGNQPAPANSGGLFPPANPALTGMAGISPIHPNADGPMIFVQPSTPISGLTGARGIWENALRQAAEKQNDGSNGTSVPPPASHELSRNQSHDNSGRGQNNHNNNGNLATNLDPPVSPMRPRAKSDSHMADIDRQIMMQMLQQQHMLLQQQQHQQNAMTQQQQGSDAWSHMSIDAWRAMVNSNEMPPPPTVDPRQLPGQDVGQQQQQQQQQIPPSPYGPETMALFQQWQQQQQLSQLQAQASVGKNRLPPLNTGSETAQAGASYPTGFSPTSLSFYQSLGIDPLSAGQLAGTASAPFFTTSFQDIPQTFMQPAPQGVQSYLGAPDMGPRRRSFAEGMGHHASGAGTPGYGVGLTAPTPYARHGGGHRRGIQSEDFGKGWGLGQGGSTTDFLQSITANDGSLLPPSRGRSHSRQSSASSARSGSPALSISSHGSSMSHHSPRMVMPDEQEMVGGKSRSKMPRMKVTSMATEVASSARRTNDGVFVCPIPGCGSTFTRHFNLKGHLRSHNDERPYKCLYDGCPKSVVGFARQHDCKRHMLLHEGLRPFECEGCGKKFARLDALTRHHKSEQGQECAITHPLPTNPDGSAMSESQYKTFKGIHDDAQPAKSGRKKSSASGAGLGDDIRVKREEDDHSGLSDFDGGGMSEYDVAA